MCDSITGVPVCAILACGGDNPDPNRPLELVRRRLDSAVRALADPVPVWDRSAARWSAALYHRVRGALQATTPVRRRGCRSRPPCCTDVLQWLCEVDGAVAGWAPSDV